MTKITTKELKDLWIKFYKNHNHKQVPSASVVPENDSSVLFTTAGMHPLIPYLMGQPHPLGTQLFDYQACIRTNDIESVGDTSHLTFFEMLGRWSLGDYDKERAIEMSFEFLTSEEYLGLPIDRIAITAFEGDEELPKDTVAYEKWRSLGIPEKQIFYLSREHNWWAVGDTGPCGPDSEMFYITDIKCDKEDCSPACSCGRYLEIGNDVFMSYNKTADGKLVELKNKNIDTGMGLERNVVVFNGYNSVYDTDAFAPAIAKIESLSGKEYGSDEFVTRAIRIIADHLRAATMILGDNTLTYPSNVGRGYVLRRLIRRTINFAKRIDIDPDKLHEVVELYILQLGEYYTYLNANRIRILEELKKEIQKFNKTITSGLREFEKVVSRMQNDEIDGAVAFRLYDTFGFPIELTQELATERGLSVNITEYKQKFAQHQEKSKGNAVISFASGLGGTGDIYTRYHTATHLLHAALRAKFGDTVKQAGSNITSQRMRFDFTFDRKMTVEEVQEVQEQVNAWIKQDLPVTRLDLTKEKAREIGAFGIFDEKYGENVSVYVIGDISKEFCTGPHVTSTKDIGEFDITKEESSSSGVRRIRAVVK